MVARDGGFRCKASLSPPALLNAELLQQQPENQLSAVTTISVSRDRAACQSPPIRPPNALATSGLVDEPGWVSVDRHTLATRFPGVYAVLTRPSSIWISAPGVTSERSAG